MIMLLANKRNNENNEITLSLIILVKLAKRVERKCLQEARLIKFSSSRLARVINHHGIRRSYVVQSS
jgi:hypothetical protein